MNDNELANLNDDSFDNLEIAGEFSITPVERSINLESSNCSKLSLSTEDRSRINALMGKAPSIGTALASSHAYL